jgi:hypothetical protein
MQRLAKKKPTLPRLAEPNVGDRIATRFDGSIRYGRVKAKFLDTFHVEFEDDCGVAKVRFKLDRTELWKVKDADPR